MIPLTYYLDLIRGVYLKGDNLNFAWQGTLNLVLLSVVTLGIAVYRFKQAQQK
ncbi:hypothetical protein NDK47_11185 [Brevibacillus ruminantium]|uniref:ABC transmembrane type-2 domain-containing protein n=1 Tax=Brevibacillus ruminantium TaxID=2950604 RepID=A0ABY4WT64_9BACL|nr:hypothetical protein [Brevibacillus ruminantium]USG67796.1 hypothetical protein NDK47_11185 [Brevibacillus ruminantium]